MFDLHCDTLLKIRAGGGLHQNDFDVSFTRLAEYGKAGQLFAIFNSGELYAEDIFGLIGLLKKEAEESPLAEFCVTASDFEKCNHRVGAFLSVEGLGNTPDYSADMISRLHGEGVRILSITWNNDNPLCGGIAENSFGMTELGRAAVSEIQRLNMALDVSHISDKGFWEAAEHEELNILATHSNSRAVHHHMRNLTDDQFSLIKSRGGVVGINTYPEFLCGGEYADVSHMIRHIEHFCALGGEKCICIGADFDGIENKMSDINYCNKLDILFNALAALNYSDSQISGIRQDNFINFLKKLN